jgi:hypothetical protein
MNVRIDTRMLVSEVGSQAVKEYCSGCEEEEKGERGVLTP